MTTEKGWWPDPSGALPVDVLPCSNGEFMPPLPTASQRTIMALADAESERLRRCMGMSRRQFVCSAAALTVGFWAIDTVGRGRLGHYGWAAQTDPHDACDLEFGGREGLEGVGNLPGEFIFDVQSHHVDPQALWRVTNPAIEVFFAAVWPQSSPLGHPPGLGPDGSLRGGGAGELDPIENLSRFHYLKELFLDSATTAAVLSCVPTSPDAHNPLPLAEAALTVHTVNDLAHSPRAVMHAFVMPNRGSAGNTLPSMKPLFLDEELALMRQRAEQHRDILRGWKTYCAWGDIPYASGWFLDTDTGMAFLDEVLAVSADLPEIPPVVATHKGFALPGFDQRAATPRDIGPAAFQYPDVRFLVYHSGYDILDTQRAYAGDANVSSDSQHVDALVKSLRENGWDASRFVAPGHTFGNVPNVYAELGSVWRNVMHSPDQAAHLMGKLITHVGPKRVVWGTDSLWYGSPQPEIVALRRFEFTAEGKEFYGLPYGLEGDVEDPTQPAPVPARTIRNGILGRNAAVAYGVDPDTQRAAISCDAVNDLRTDYLLGAGSATETRPLATNQVLGARSRRELITSWKDKRWSP